MVMLFQCVLTGNIMMLLEIPTTAIGNLSPQYNATQHPPSRRKDWEAARKAAAYVANMP